MLEGQIEFSTIKLSELDGISNRIDAEFYQRKHLLLEKKMKMVGSSQLSTSGVKLDCSAFYPSITDFYNFEGAGVPFLRVNEIQNGLVKTTEGTAFLPESILDANQSTICRASPFDIIIAKGGNSLAKLGLVPEDYPTYALSRDLIALKTDGLMRNKYFVWLFLHCDFGQSLLWRTASQTGQPHLTLPSISALNIPIFSEAFEVIAEKLYRQSEISQSRAVAAYGDAESLLLSTISMVDFSPKAESISIKSFKDSFGMTGRLDAEYYQPKFDHLLGLLKRDGLTIGDVAPPRHKRFESSKTGDFEYIEIGGMRGDGTVASESVRCAEAPSRATQRVRQGDIVTSTVRPIRRLSALITLAQNDYVCSSGFVVLQPVQITAETLLVYLRLPIICELMDLHTSASLYPAISEKDLLGLPIPKIPVAVQNEIASLVQQSFTLKAQSEHLLEAAKRAVEIAIEQDEAAGMAYLAIEGALA